MVKKNSYFKEPKSSLSCSQDIYHWTLSRAEHTQSSTSYTHKMICSVYVTRFCSSTVCWWPVSEKPTNGVAAFGPLHRSYILDFPFSHTGSLQEAENISEEGEAAQKYFWQTERCSFESCWYRYVPRVTDFLLLWPCNW